MQLTYPELQAKLKEYHQMGLLNENFKLNQNKNILEQNYLRLEAINNPFDRLREIIKNQNIATTYQLSFPGKKLRSSPPEIGNLVNLRYCGIDPEEFILET